MARYARLELEDSQGNELTTPGVFGTSWYLPEEELQLDPNPTPLNRNDEQRGVNARLPVAQDIFAPTGRLVMRHYPNYLGAVLMMLFGDVTSTPGDGIITDPDGGTIPTGARRHVFTKTDGPVPKSGRITAAYGPSGAWVRARGVTVESVAFALEADGVKATAALLANLVYRLTSDPSLTPSYDAFSILPFRRRNTSVTVTGAGTEKVDTVAFTLAQNLEQIRDMGYASAFPTDTERNNGPDGFLGLTGTLNRRDFDPAMWDAIMNCTSFVLKIKMQSEQNIGVSGYPYSMWVECPAAQYLDGSSEPLKNQPRHEMSSNWHAPLDDVSNKDFTVTLVNGVAAYKA